MIDAETVHAVIGQLAKVISFLGIGDRSAFESARRRLAEDLCWWLVPEAGMVEVLQGRPAAPEATSSESRIQAVPDKEMA